MTLSHEPGHDDQLVRYLLGLLPDEDAERIDEMNLADHQIAWRLRVVEDDLVDAYVSGTLAGATLERFESFYLSSERRRQKVRFARSFLGAVDRGAEPTDIDAGHDSVRVPGSERDGTSIRNSYRSIVPRSRAAWRLAAAAALFLLACGALYEDVRLHSALNEARRASAVSSNRAHVLEQQLNDQRVASAGVVKELENHAPRTAAARNSAAARPTDSTEGASRALPTIALVLLPQTRAVGPIATLAVPQGIDGVALELRLEPNDFTRYQVALRDPVTNHIIWRSDRIIGRTVDDMPTVSVIVPARALRAQHYSIELDGLSAAGGAQVVGSYVFQMVRR